jgi:hypothetical protein
MTGKKQNVEIAKSQIMEILRHLDWHAMEIQIEEAL